MTYRRRSFGWGVFTLVACVSCALTLGGCEDKVSDSKGDPEPLTLIVDSIPPAKVERPSWIDNSTIVFAWDQGTQNTQLWRISLQGSQPTRFINDDTREYLNPTYSAGLDVVAFQILDNPANPSEGYNIDGVFRTDPTIRTRIVSHAESGSSSYPSWGVDGTNLGYMVTVNKVAYFVMQGVEVNQGIIRKVGDPDVVSLGQASRVNWHGPTNRVAYNRVPPMAVTGNAIYYYDLGTPAEVQLTDQDTADGSDDQNPSWSPSGNHIVYSSFLDVDFRHELYIVSAATKAVRRLTRTGEDEIDPAWSPDGSRIAYVSNGDLYVLLVDAALLPQ
jgi:Tol biopolymer transport system component